jgi:hypothetical protein
VKNSSAAKLQQANIVGVFFELTRESWKVQEGPFGPFWGMPNTLPPPAPKNLRIVL